MVFRKPIAVIAQPVTGLCKGDGFSDRLRGAAVFADGGLVKDG